MFLQDLNSAEKPQGDNIQSSNNPSTQVLTLCCLNYAFRRFSKIKSYRLPTQRIFPMIPSYFKIEILVKPCSWTTLCSKGLNTLQVMTSSAISLYFIIFIVSSTQERPDSNKNFQVLVLSTWME